MTRTFKGIYSEEILTCSCVVKRYTGGKVVHIATRKCTATPKHRDTVKHICGNCGLVTSKVGLKIHKNTVHSI